jgi:hypothetical protein
MVKKKNKTLESVLLVLKALDNKISQPVVEQVLKECDGCTQKAIEILESIVIKVRKESLTPIYNKTLLFTNRSIYFESIVGGARCI